jgi:hypothetical protein
MKQTRQPYIFLIVAEAAARKGSCVKRHKGRRRCKARRCTAWQTTPYITFYPYLTDNTGFCRHRRRKLNREAKAKR